MSSARTSTGGSGSRSFLIAYVIRASLGSSPFGISAKDSRYCFDRPLRSRLYNGRQPQCDEQDSCSFINFEPSSSRSSCLNAFDRSSASGSSECTLGRVPALRGASPLTCNCRTTRASSEHPSSSFFLCCLSGRGATSLGGS